METLTLEKAIKHAKKAAINKSSEIAEKIIGMIDVSGCIKCKEEYEQLAKWLEELKEYKDLEEQGRLPKLPCSAGDTVYYIAPKRRTYEKLEIRFFTIFSENEIYMKCDSMKLPHINYGEIDINEIGKTVFLTKEEADAALKKKNQRKAKENE